MPQGIDSNLVLSHSLDRCHVLMPLRLALELAHIPEEARPYSPAACNFRLEDHMRTHCNTTTNRRRAKLSTPQNVGFSKRPIHKEDPPPCNSGISGIE